MKQFLLDVNYLRVAPPGTRGSVVNHTIIVGGENETLAGQTRYNSFSRITFKRNDLISPHGGL